MFKWLDNSSATSLCLHGLAIGFWPSDFLQPIFHNLDFGTSIDWCSHVPDFHSNMHEAFFALGKRGNFKISQDEFGGLCDKIVSKLDEMWAKCPPRTLPRQPSRAAEMLAAINQFKSNTEPVYNLFIWNAVIASVLVAIYEREVLWALKPSPLNPPIKVYLFHLLAWLLFWQS